MDVGRTGLQHRRPAGHGHVGVDHALHDSQPHQRHGIHGAGDRDPDRRRRRPALGRDDGDAESAAAAATAAGDGPCAGAGGGGRPGQRAAGGDLDGGGQRHGLHGAVDVGRTGLQHRRPAGHGHVGVDHALHDSQPHQRHGIHGAGDRDPNRRRRRPALGRDDGDAESAAAATAAGDGPCAGDGGGGRPGQRAAGGDLDGGGQRHGLHGAVDVERTGLQHRRPAGHGHVGVDHALHDSQPHQRHGIHGAGDRDPNRRRRRPALGRDDGDAESAAAAAGDGPCAGDGGGGRPGQRAAGGDLDGGGQRHGLHGAVDVERTGLQHRRPAGHGHVGVDHALHDSQPHQRHGIHGAGDRDPDRRHRRPAVGGGEGDALHHARRAAAPEWGAGRRSR